MGTFCNNSKDLPFFSTELCKESIHLTVVLLNQEFLT